MEDGRVQTPLIKFLSFKFPYIYICKEIIIMEKRITEEINKASFILKQFCKGRTYHRLKCNECPLFSKKEERCKFSGSPQEWII